MIKQKLTILAATIAVAASITSSQAALVTGGIGFYGLPTFVGGGGTAGTATGVSSLAPAGVLITSGSFSIIPIPTPVTFATPWTFNSGPVSSFWTVSGGGETFVFNLTSSYIYNQDPTGDSITVYGTGTVTGTGLIDYSETTINWKFSSTESDVTSFSATASTVPEPSTVVAGALLLLPFGISTVRILRKNKNA